MRRVSKDRGFLISMIFNMLFRAEWVLIAIILFVVHHFFEKVPLWLGFAALVIWVGYSLIITLVFSLANRMGNAPEVIKENKNPYSGTNNTVTYAGNKSNDDQMCPCCKRYKLNEIGKYEVCPVCNWEDDPVARQDPDYVGGANHLSLNEARAQYKMQNEE